MNKRVETLTANEFLGNDGVQNDIILVAIELDNPQNIGGLIRLAGNIGCKKVLFPNIKTFNQKKIRVNATNAYSKIDWEFCELENWEKKIPEDYEIIGLETGKNAKNIYKTTLSKKIALVVGNESYGLRDKDLEKCHSRVYIPVPGVVKSLNVKQAAAIALFEYLRQTSNF
jgi:tRNA G18 (ribose-2'-O)-methylase SpoU